jgi:hypothetical protein
MNILIATQQTQGARKSDFCHAREGEVVTFGSECDGESVDGGCGCRRSLIGCETLKGTTTMKVVESQMDLPALALWIAESYRRAGWEAYSSAEDIKAMATVDARQLIYLARHFDVGDIVERRGKIYRQRTDPARRHERVREVGRGR